MERRVRGNSHARCGAGENPAITSRDYLSLLLCFDTAIDAEKFCSKKSAVFIVMPEENPNAFFMISLLIQQLYREILSVADEHGGRLSSRVMFYCDELGTLPAIQSAEMMFSASRSRGMSIAGIIQSDQQLEKNYGREGAAIILDNCQITIAGGFAPSSETADRIGDIFNQHVFLVEIYSCTVFFKATPHRKKRAEKAIEW